VSLFQDDNHLVYSGSSTVERTLGILQSLGVQRLRVTVEWSLLAPAAGSRARPRNFNASDPAAYPPGAWASYDRIVLLAAQRGMGVEFSLTAPGPLWAMQPDAPTRRAANHWKPDPGEFGAFVYAVGKRYSGTYGGLPRVHDFSIWNEPNQPGWLAPQWSTVGGHHVAASPRMYRTYVRAAYGGLVFSGHDARSDTVLVGELAPEGYEKPGFYTAMTPMPFLRALYCVNKRNRPLRGGAAAALGCPTGGSRHDFVAANPALFYASGFAHHPYYFFRPPSFSAPDPNYVPLANLGRLERALNRIYRAYGVRRRIPIYLTEYGYQTKPPDPHQRFTPAQQAAFLNEADHMAWRDSRVKTVSQFLLYDDVPDRRFRPSQRDYWDTFQTGLLFANGKRKPAFNAYRLPIWIPTPRTHRGGRILVWGQVRPAAGHRSQRLEIQWRSGHGRFRTIASARTAGSSGYLNRFVRPPGSGQIRLAWRARGGKRYTSRAARITVA
jgi:hypothetical protein